MKPIMIRGPFQQDMPHKYTGTLVRVYVPVEGDGVVFQITPGDPNMSPVGGYENTFKLSVDGARRIRAFLDEAFEEEK